jgi:hypothetical protein
MLLGAERSSGWYGVVEMAARRARPPRKARPSGAPLAVGRAAPKAAASLSVGHRRGASSATRDTVRVLYGHQHKGAQRREQAVRTCLQKQASAQKRHCGRVYLMRLCVGSALRPRRRSPAAGLMTSCTSRLTRLPDHTHGRARACMRKLLATHDTAVCAAAKMVTRNGQVG